MPADPELLTDVEGGRAMSLNTYTVKVVQFKQMDYGMPKREAYGVMARSAQEAIAKALREVRGDGFYKSYPIEVEEVSILNWSVVR